MLGKSVKLAEKKNIMDDSLGVVFDIIDDLRDGEAEKMVMELDVFLACVPYDMHMYDENNLHNA